MITKYIIYDKIKQQYISEIQYAGSRRSGVLAPDKVNFIYTTDIKNALMFEQDKVDYFLEGIENFHEAIDLVAPGNLEKIAIQINEKYQQTLVGYDYDITESNQEE